MRIAVEELLPCEFRRDGLCEVSSKLASLSVPAATDACHACLAHRYAKAVNPITCSKAIYWRAKMGLPPTAELLEGVRPPEVGVGTELQSLIESTRRVLSWMRLDWILPQGDKCGCSSTRNQMNAAGSIGCNAKRQYFTEEILIRWIQHFRPIVSLPGARLLIGLFLRFAIFNARRKGL